MRQVLTAITNFARDRQGVAAVEFAMVLPMLLVLYLGGIAICDGVSTNRKLTDATAQLTNVAAQFTTMQASDAQGLMAAISQIMSPYAAGSVAEVLTLVGVDAAGNATVTWSQSYNGGAALAKGTSVHLPLSLAQPNMSVVWVQTSYTYTTSFSQNYVPPLVLRAQLFGIPRSSASIPCSDC